MIINTFFIVNLFYFHLQRYKIKPYIGMMALRMSEIIVIFAGGKIVETIKKTLIITKETLIICEN